MFSILTWYSLENSTTGLSLQYLSSTYRSGKRFSSNCDSSTWQPSTAPSRFSAAASISPSSRCDRAPPRSTLIMFTAVCITWKWLSINPGSTVPPLASMTCVPGRTSFCQSSPRPAAQIIFPAAATQSAPPSPHMVTQRPFLMMISAYIASRPPVESRVVLWPYCTPGRAVCPVALCPRRQMYQNVG